MVNKTSTKRPKRVLRTARFRLLPLTLAMLFLLLVVKLNGVYLHSRELNELLAVRDATASSAPKKEAEDGGHGGGDAAGKAPDGAQPTVGGEPATYGEGKLTLKQVEAMKTKDSQTAYSQTELDILQNLTKRREELDQRARDLELKATVLDATEKRINDKIGEMKSLQTELAKVVAEYKQQQDSEVQSLVKIYESMKPGDAAAIFNEMDMPILLEVIDRMSERKVAPILAGMSPTRARDVTQELAELRKGRQGLADSANRATAP